MTEEQICELAKDKALDIQKYIIDGHVDIDSFAKDCCLAGAHSRNEEITRLSAEIKDDNYVISKLREEINQLRNPWVNIREQKPQLVHENSDCLYSEITLFKIQTNMTELYALGVFQKDKQTSEERIIICDKMGHNIGYDWKITHWMPIPQGKEA